MPTRKSSNACNLELLHEHSNVQPSIDSCCLSAFISPRCRSVKFLSVDVLRRVSLRFSFTSSSSSDFKITDILLAPRLVGKLKYFPETRSFFLPLSIM